MSIVFHNKLPFVFKQCARAPHCLAGPLLFNKNTQPLFNSTVFRRSTPWGRFRFSSTKRRFVRAWWSAPSIVPQVSVSRKNTFVGPHFTSTCRQATMPEHKI